LEVATLTSTISRTTRYDDLPDVLTVEEVGRYLGIGRNSAYELANGELGAVRIGSRRMIVPKTSLGKYLGLSNTGPAGTP
jgi:excisionase family DNA binding protein